MESPSAKEQSMTQNCLLPDEILLDEIVPRLPAKSVIRFKSVSKTWLSRISQYSSLVATKHTAREEPVTIIVAKKTTEKEMRNRIFFLGHSVSNLVEIDTSYLWKKNPDPTQSCLKLIGSCNGLVCLQLCYSYENRDLVLWNPATREVNYLPAATVIPGYCCESDRDAGAAYVLGFDTQTGDHKVVRLDEVMTDGDDLVKKAQIFSRKSGNWRELKSFNMGSDRIISWEEGVTIDGAIYWSVTKINIHFDTFAIMSFDLSTEEFQEFEGPPVEVGTKLDYLDLLKWKGSLCALWVKPTVSQLWLKNDSNIGWTEISTVYHSRRPLSATKYEILYNLPSTFKRVAVDGPLRGLYRSGICHHFHTLVSPN